jgi:V/A-type H+-transporting ATPase subunit E
MSKLDDILQEEVRGEIEAMLTDAESRSAELIRDAEEKASARMKSHQKKMQNEALAATRRARSAAELRISTARMQAKGQVIESVRKKALMAVEEIVKRRNYRDILEAFGEEALKAVEGAKWAVVHPEDKETMREWAAQKGLQLLTDPGLRLGVKIVDTSGERSVENSLPERLDRAWNTLASEVAKKLWG